MDSCCEHKARELEALRARHRTRLSWVLAINGAIIANLSVLGASGAVAALHAGWPDVAVGLGIAALFLHSALSVIRDALAQLRDPTRAAAHAGPS